jgi:nucleotide-binding universal stress UspA family protein
MTYTSLLVHVEPGDEAVGRLQTACALAARFEALLIGVGAAVLEAPIVDPTGFVPIDPDLLASERRDLETELADIAQQFRAAATAKNLRMDWRSNLEFPLDMICRHASAADLLIVGRGASAATLSPQHVVNAGDLLMQAGRPVLVVPPGIAALGLDHAIVAWRNTREARRAVVDAIPLLKLADNVSVVAFYEPDDAAIVGAEIEDLVAFLARHKIAATPELRQTSHEHVAAGILRLAEEMQGDLIVAGAYGHARLREWVFGGVTHDLLKNSPIACCLSH